jgi:hypothetical protein
MKLLNNNGRRFYIDFEKELNNDEIERARFLFLQEGVFLDFQTKVWRWSYIAKVTSDGKVRCAIKDGAQHRLNILCEVLKENKKEEVKQ